MHMPACLLVLETIVRDLTFLNDRKLVHTIISHHDFCLGSWQLQYL